MRISERSRRTSGDHRAVALLLALLAASFALFAGTARPALAADAGTFRFASSTYSAGEGTYALIYMTRTCTDCAPATIQYSASYGGGLAPADINNWDPAASSNNVTFASGETTRLVSAMPTPGQGIFITDDTANDPGETLTLTITGGGTIGTPASTTLTINDNDGPVNFTFSAPNYNVSEGDGSVAVTINRAGSAGQPVSVRLNTANGTAVAPGDYTAVGVPTPLTVSFAAGETSQVRNISITDDGVSESTESFSLALSSPMINGSPGGTVGSNATVTIADNDGAGTFAFSQATFNVAESVGNAQLDITRTGGTTGSATLACTVTGGSAGNPADYTSNQVFVTFNSGQQTGACAFPVVNDSTVESLENVTLGLSVFSGVGSVSGQTSTTLQINDDDGSGTFSFAQASYSVAENVASGRVTITVNRNSTSGSANVSVSTVTGTAGASDFTPISNQVLFFANGQSQATFDVLITNDPYPEIVTEQFSVTLSNPSTGSIGSPSTATISIIDDETGGPVTITGLSPASGPPGGGTQVTINGTGFEIGCTVAFGGVTAQRAPSGFINSTQMIYLAPTHAIGVVDVVATCQTGSSANTSADDYTYTAGPTVTAVTPNSGSGAGGNIVMLTGTNFVNVTNVFFGSTQATQFVANTATQLNVVVPAGTAGTVDVTVVTAGGTSPNTPNDDYTYTSSANLPVITSVSPAQVQVNTSGTTTTITGSNFTGVTGVTIGGSNAPIVGTPTSTSIVVTVPARTSTGTVEVVVTTPAGSNGTTGTQNDFTYTAASTQTTTITLYVRWTLLAWQGVTGNALALLQGQDDSAATNDVSSFVTAIYWWNASGVGCPTGQDQCWFAFFPDGVNIPGANNFSTLTNGQAYWVAISGSQDIQWTVKRGP